MNHSRVWIKMNGQRLTVNQAALRIGISVSALWSRVFKGVPQEELLKPGRGPRLKIVPPPPATPVKPASARQNFIAAMSAEIDAEEYLQREGELQAADDAADTA